VHHKLESSAEILYLMAVACRLLYMSKEVLQILWI